MCVHMLCNLSNEKDTIEWLRGYTFDFIFNLCSLAIVEAKSYLSKNEFPYAERMNQFVLQVKF